MNQIVPPPLLFDYRFQVPACSGPAKRKTGRLLNLPPQASLPAVSSMNGVQPFASLSLGWNAEGLGLCVSVRGRSTPAVGNPLQLEKSDAVELWIDTRPTGTVHRASGYCQRVACLPADETAGGQPSVRSVPIPQQREVRQELQPQQVQLRCHTAADGYDLEVWIAGSQLYGYRQMDELRQLGFYSLVRDTELGEQPLTVSDEMPFHSDPSLWVQLELTD